MKEDIRSADFGWFDCMHTGHSHAWGIAKLAKGLEAMPKKERAETIKRAEETLASIWQKVFTTRATDLQAIRMKMDMAETATAARKELPPEVASVFADIRAYLDSNPRGPRVVPDNVWNALNEMEPDLLSLDGLHETLSDLTERGACSEGAGAWMALQLGQIVGQVHQRWRILRQLCSLVPIETAQAMAKEKADA